MPATQNSAENMLGATLAGEDSGIPEKDQVTDTLLVLTGDQQRLHNKRMRQMRPGEFSCEQCLCKNGASATMTDCQSQGEKQTRMLNVPSHVSPEHAGMRAMYVPDNSSTKTHTEFLAQVHIE